RLEKNGKITIRFIFNLGVFSWRYYLNIKRKLVGFIDFISPVHLSNDYNSICPVYPSKTKNNSKYLYVF
ncbi:MAG: hypothetical protein KAI99_23525, partial [Cyclobacteriaceae bacterium]|nr:hypothetical protein [Cyclobacteriaceae bacterium]